MHDASPRITFYGDAQGHNIGKLHNMSSTVYQVFVNYRLVKCGSEWHVAIPGQLKIYKMVFAASR